MITFFVRITERYAPFDDLINANVSLAIPHHGTNSQAEPSGGYISEYGPPLLEPPWYTNDGKLRLWHCFPLSLILLFCSKVSIFARVCRGLQIAREESKSKSVSFASIFSLLKSIFEFDFLFTALSASSYVLLAHREW